jgi:hypothetical protein
MKRYYLLFILIIGYFQAISVDSDTFLSFERSKQIFLSPCCTRSFIQHFSELKTDTIPNTNDPKESGKKLNDRLNRHNDPNYTRLLYSNNSRLLQKGEGYYLNQMLLISGIAYGITDYLNVHAGFLVDPKKLIGPLSYISIRGGTKLGDFLSTSAGFTYMRIDNGFVYFPYLSAGVGTNKFYFSASYIPGAGITNYGYTSIANAFTFGANIKLIKFISLVSDNWIFSVSDRFNTRYNVLNTPSIGLRFYGKKFSFDAGLIGLLNGPDERSALPWLTYTYHFSFKREKRPD